LNSQDEFEGGGTFFENLLLPIHDPRSDNSCADSDHVHPCEGHPIIRPNGVGHVVAHMSTERHAGAPTVKGIREILVFFLTLRPNVSSTERIGQGSSIAPRAPPVERAFHLKLAAKEMTVASSAIMCLDMALKERPMDGEAHFWKGFRMLYGGISSDCKGRSSSNDRDETIILSDIKKSIHHMQRAQQYTPFDARSNCFVGVAYKRMIDFLYRKKEGSSDPAPEIRHDDRLILEESVKYLQNAIGLQEQYQQYGISSDFDPVVAILSISEVLSRLHRYKEALDYIALLQEHENDTSERWRRKGLTDDEKQHASELARYCLDKINIPLQHV
jgi:tetratricopeptide (TPR) repeat protein